MLQQSMVDRLDAGLPAAIAHQAAMYASDPVALAAPFTIRKQLTATEQEFPVVYVVPGRAVPREQTSRWLTREQDMLVIVEHRTDTEALLQEALQLYEAALMQALLGPQPPYPAHTIMWKGTNPGPLFQVTGGAGLVQQSYLELTFGCELTEEGIDA